MIDVNKLRTVLRHIDDNPDLHDQSEILKKGTDCGTIGCLAGHTIMLFTNHQILWCANNAGTTWRAAEVITPEGRKTGILEEAQYILGLSGEQADRLFDPDISFSEMWWLANIWTDGKIFREETT